MAKRLNNWWQRWLLSADEALTRARGMLESPSAVSIPSRSLQLSDLEPRVLFSATPIDPAMMPAGDEATMVVEVESPSTESETTSIEALAAETPSDQTVSELILIDADVPDIQQLLDDLHASGRQAEVYVLDANRDGVDQITELLEQRSDLRSIHVISHAADGAVKLGNTWLSDTNINGYAGQIASWQGALTADADILFYGCDLASSEDGRALVDSISALSGADVAASVDDTGHAAIAGDWDLEHQVGVIETDVAISADAQATWLNVLQLETVSDSFDSVSYSNNDGSQAWSTSWQEVGDFGGASGGDIEVVTTDSGALRLGGSIIDVGDYVWRQADLSGATSATLSLDAKRENGMIQTTAVNLDVRAHPTDSWTTLANFDQIPYSYTGYNFDVTAFISPEMQIRLDTTIADTDYIYFDNIQIEYETASLVVDTELDVLDGNTNSVDELLANKGADGLISLREAIIATNNTAGADTILLAAESYVLSISGDDDTAMEGDLDILDELTIFGDSAATTIIDAAGIDRVFEVRTNLGNLTMFDTTVRGGVHGGDGGGIFVKDGGSQLTLQRVIVSGNSADDGGGIFNKGTMTLTDVVVDNNTAVSEGGGIHNKETATLNQVTVSNNQADLGAGIHNDNTAEDLWLTNVTVSGNDAVSAGGGLYNQATATIVNSTFTLNDADSGGGVRRQSGTITISNTIVAGNTAVSANPDVQGSFDSQGYNLIEDLGSSSGWTGDDLTLIGADLDTLEDNGGFGKTHALLADSQAIDAGTTTGAPSVDQRGVSRDANPDIGAYETFTPGIWLSTAGNVTGSGVPGLDAWQNGEVIELNNASFSSGLNLETVAGTNLDIDGMHYVTRNLTLGTTHTIALQQGDLLFTTNADETINSLDVQKYDVMLFRPDSPGDYSSGTFSFVLTGLSGTVDLKSLSLVEQDTTFGDTTLFEGDFLFTQEGASGNDIYVFRTVDVGDGTTGGTSELLIAGSDVGITAAIDGLELLETPTTHEGETLAAGELLVSVDDTDASIGTSDITVTENDVFRLQVVKTTAVTGTSIADAVLFVDGGSLGLDTSGEDIDALTSLSAGNPGATPSSTLTVTTETDVLDGDTSSVAALLANKGADGEISLREAITAANATDGLNTIHFDIAGTGPHVIALDTANGALPDITGTLIIDATTEPDYVDAPVIQIDGTALSAVAGDNYDALRLTGNSHGSTIRGLSITGFTDGGARGDAIDITSDHNTIAGNYIGLAPNGTTVDGNNVGIKLHSGADSNVIGGANADDRNYISGGIYAGVVITGSSTNDNRIFGNRIGLDSNGDVVASGSHGIAIWNGASGNQVGGANPSEGNRIAGYNNGVIVDANSADSLDNAILGNEIFSVNDMAIDLNNDGVTANDSGDSDSGPNDLLNHPILTNLTQDGPDLDVEFNLDVPAGTYRVEFFDNPAGIGGTGLGEGQVFLGAVTVTHTGGGTRSFSETLSGVTATDLESVTTTATEDLGGSYGSTSEFSAPLSQIAPSLSGANDLTSINEDPISNPGTLVSDLIAGQASDPNSADVLGIAVIDVDDTNGDWEYSINGGTDWFDLNSVSASTARLLTADTDTRVRFAPDADWTGTVTNGITFHAWDGTIGTNGGTADISATGMTWRDEFNVVDYGNNDGTENWGSQWIEISDEGSPASGQITITGGALRIGNQDGDFFDAEERVSRAADLSGVASATLSFDFQVLGGVEEFDEARVQVSDDGGGSWTTLESFAGDGPTSGSRNYDITAFANADTQIRFRIGSQFWGADEYFAVDNVQISSSSTLNTGGQTAFSVASASSSIQVNPLNDAPTLTGFLNAVDTTSENTEVEIDFGDLTAWGDEADVDGTVDAFVVKAVSSGTLRLGTSAGTATAWAAGSNDTIDATTRAYWTPALAANGLLNAFEVVAEDDQGVESSTNVQVQVTVTSVNSAPTLAGGPFALTGTDEDTTSVGTQVLTILGGLSTSDLDGDTLGLAIHDASGNGTWSYSVDSTDGIDGNWTAMGPVSGSSALLLSNNSWVRYEPDHLNGESVSITFHAWDGSTNSASTTGSPSYANPGTGGGSTAFSTGTAQAALIVTNLDDVPVIGGDTDGSVTEDDAATLTAIGDLEATGGDAGEDLFTAETLNGTYGDLTVNAAGSWTYTADNSQTVIQELSQSDTLSDVFTVTNADGVTTAMVTITINGNDDVPVITGDVSGSVTEDDAATLTTSGDLDAVGGDAGEELFNAETLTGSYGDLAVTATGGWTYTADNSPTAIQELGTSDTLTETFIVTDADDATATTVTITINGLNDTPTVNGPIADQNATQDTSFTFQFADTAFDDADNDTLTYSATLDDSSPLPGWLTFDGATRTFSGTPANGDVGTITIRVTADDGNGGAVFDDFSLTVDNTNDAPVVINSIADQGATEGSPFSLQFAANTFDDIDGDTLTYTATLDDSSPLPGWLSFDANTRTFAGTPTDTDVGSVTVRVTANDGNGGATNEDFVLTVANVNNAPTDITLDNNSIDENVDGGVIGNLTVSDPDVGDTHVFSVSDTRFTVDGTQLKLKDGQTLNHESESTVTLTITATDQGGAGVDFDKPFTIVVDDVNEAPVSNADAYNVFAGDTLAATAGGVLAGDSDPDGDALNAILVTGPSHGTLTLNPDGSFVYTPDSGFTGTDTFLYEASDGSASSGSTLVTINVTPLFAPPVPVPEPRSEPDPNPDGDPEPEDGEDEETETPELMPGVGDAPNTPGNSAPTPQPEAAEPLIPTGDTEESSTLTMLLEAQAAANGKGPNSVADRAVADEALGPEKTRSSATHMYSASSGIDHALMIGPGLMWNQLDEQLNEVESQIHGDLIVVGTAGAAASSFTIGAVAWALRSGFLASGLLAQMPAWKAIDPLLVFQGVGEDGNGETLEELMDRQTEMLDDEPTPTA